MIIKRCDSIGVTLRVKPETEADGLRLQAALAAFKPSVNHPPTVYSNYFYTLWGRRPLMNQLENFIKTGANNDQTTRL